MPPTTPSPLQPAPGPPADLPAADARVSVMAWLLELGQIALHRIAPAPSVGRLPPRR